MADKIDILYEDNHLIIVNKPGGRLVQGDKTGDQAFRDDVGKFIKTRDDKPGNVFVGVVHRLDRPVSGCLIFAKTSKALSRMNTSFRNGEVNKIYWAITPDRPPKMSDRLTHYLLKDKKHNVVKAFGQGGSARGRALKKAVLDYKLLAEIDQLSLLEIKPLTGRPHQIRVQLAAIGCPILSDVKYGSPKRPHKRFIYLHGRSLQFVHPVQKKPIVVHAPLPKDPIWSVFADFQEES
jgi:23S rRNA pseudouridine1911/1915/1917 synthase